LPEEEALRAAWQPRGNSLADAPAPRRPARRRRARRERARRWQQRRNQTHRNGARREGGGRPGNADGTYGGSPRGIACSGVRKPRAFARARIRRSGSPETRSSRMRSLTAPWNPRRSAMRDPIARITISTTVLGCHVTDSTRAARHVPLSSRHRATSRCARAVCRCGAFQQPQPVRTVQSLLFGAGRRCVRLHSLHRRAVKGAVGKTNSHVSEGPRAKPSN
jgi:hypothetical protein